MEITITTHERTVFLDKTVEITNRIFENEHEGKLFYKMLVGYFNKLDARKLQIGNSSQSNFENDDKINKHFSEVLILMSDLETGDSELTPYTPSLVKS